jgi:preprotein translocase subunit SecD
MRRLKAVRITIVLSLVLLFVGCTTNKIQNSLTAKSVLEIRLGSFEKFSGATGYSIAEGRDLVYLQSNWFLDAGHVKAAQLAFDSSMQPVIELTLNKIGTTILAEISRNNINKLVAILVDNKVVFAATIRDPILQGRVMIAGFSSVDEAQSLKSKIDQAIKNS